MNRESITPVSYLGHVKNGVVVLDTLMPFHEGQIVRVEPLKNEIDQAKIHQLEQLFALWTEEDARLSPEEADCLQNALANEPRLTLRSPNLD